LPGPCRRARVRRAGAHAHAIPLKANVIHWWTSGGESAASRSSPTRTTRPAAPGSTRRPAASRRAPRRSTAWSAASAHRSAVQHVQAVPRPDRPGHAQQRRRTVAAKENWDKILPQPILESIKIKGHFYAAPVDIHMPAWFFYSKPAFAKAGIAAEPKTFDELFADLDKLKAAGTCRSRFGGQPWQEKITFYAVARDVGGTDMYMKLYRDKDAECVNSPPSRRADHVQASAQLRRRRARPTATGTTPPRW
jgi:glucose/mannose transport system substrate-binding protein